MNDLARESEPRPEANVEFADARARAELAGRVEMFAAPQAFEGREAERIKRNARRTVWRLRLDGREYYLKHYSHRGPLRRLRKALLGDDARRELALSRRLRSAGVSAIEVLAIGRAGPISWMLSRSAQPCEPGDAYHDRLAARPGENRRAIRRATRALASLTAGMHAAGVLHHDLHCGNVLVAGDADRPRLVLTDLHRASARRRPLSRRAWAKNLAQLLYDRRHRTTRTDRLRFLRHYLRCLENPRGTLRGWRALIEHFADRLARRQYAQRDRRVFGDNRYFGAVKLGAGWSARVIRASKRQPPDSRAAATTFTDRDWREALAGLDEMLAGPWSPPDAAGVMTAVRSLRVGPETLRVLCRRKPCGLWETLASPIRRPTGLRCFARGHALLTRRIPTALPLAALTRRTGPLARESVWIVEAGRADEPLNRFLTRALGGADAPLQRRLAHEILRQLGRLLRRLQGEGFVHRELSGANLIVSAEAQPRVRLTGLALLRRRRRVSTREAFGMLLRLNVALLECPPVTHAGRLRMLLAYLRRPGSGTIGFKPYWRWLQRRSAEVLQRQIAARQRDQRRRRRRP